MSPERTKQFLDEIATQTGFPALSEAKMSSLGDPEMSVLIMEEDRIVAVGVTARHAHGDGSAHHAIETAVIPSMQFPAFEKVVAEAALTLAPVGPISFWSMRSTLDVALGQLGFITRRTLTHMVTDLPLVASRAELRSLADGEEVELVDINNAAFSAHREASAMTLSEFKMLAREPWFDRSGIIVATHNGKLAGFCWTKVHPGGEGEIYRIAVDPEAQGLGLGRELVLAGFGHLFAERGVGRGTLWVDGDNTVAISLYESIGMSSARFNREFERVG